MDINTIKQKIKQQPKIKKFILSLIVHPIKTRPRLWMRLLLFLYLKKGKGSILYRSVRKDIVPFNSFELGQYSVIESFSVLNNMVGPILIGNHTRIGIGNTLIGPVQIGNHVNLAQHITVSGLNHNYTEVNRTISAQGVCTQAVSIEDDVWVGANSVILPGVTIGKHAVIAAGTIVSRSVPPYSVCAGNPGKIIKQYDFNQQAWVRTNPEKEK